MLGYMTAREAKLEGFTHHGSYYGIPVWIGDPDGDCIVATKWAPMELLMSVFHYMEAFVRGLAQPDEEPCFQFLVKGEIK